MISISDNSTTTSNMMFLTSKHIDENLHDRFIRLPRLESPTLPSLPIYQSFNHDQMVNDTQPSSLTNHASCGNEDRTQVDDAHDHDHQAKTRLSDWVAFDRMVASQLNGAQEGEDTTQHELSCFDGMAFCPPDHHQDVQFSDIRSSTRQSQISHVYNTSENDIWSVTKSSSSPISSSSDPLSHLSV